MSTLWTIVTWGVDGWPILPLWVDGMVLGLLGVVFFAANRTALWRVEGPASDWDREMLRDDVIGFSLCSIFWPIAIVVFGGCLLCQRAWDVLVGVLERKHRRVNDRNPNVITRRAGEMADELDQLAAEIADDPDRAIEREQLRLSADMLRPVDR